MEGIRVNASLTFTEREMAKSWSSQWRIYRGEEFRWNFVCLRLYLSSILACASWPIIFQVAERRPFKNLNYYYGRIYRDRYFNWDTRVRVARVYLWIFRGTLRFVCGLYFIKRLKAGIKLNFPFLFWNLHNYLTIRE